MRLPSEVRERPALTASKVDARAASSEIDREVRALAAGGSSVYRIDEERLAELRPGLIVTQDTCEVCAVSLEEVREAACRSLGSRVEIVSLSPLTLDNVFGDIERVGRAAGVERRAGELVSALRARLARLAQETAGLPRPRVLVLEWLAPPMVAGHWTRSSCASRAASPSSDTTAGRPVRRPGSASPRRSPR